MLHINDLTYRLGPRLLFDKATVALPDGRAGRLRRPQRHRQDDPVPHDRAASSAPEDGAITTCPRRCGSAASRRRRRAARSTLIEFVLAADVERAALLAEAETATDPHRIAEIQTRLVDIDAHSAPARAAASSHGLGFDHDAQKRALSEFSGGWRMRVALAAVLFSAPDLLLLDEPTNYLDLEGTLWLMDYLARYPHTVLVISHDRDLLDAVADHILHLDQAQADALSRRLRPVRAAARASSRRCS